MKKTIFCISTMLLAATVFSQNVSSIMQVGMDNDVNFERQESGEEVVGGVVVDTYFNASDISQNGNTNGVYIYQIGQNKSLINQDGDTNYVYILQDGGDNRIGYGSALMQGSEIDQIGDDNYAYVGQWGEGQSSIVSQMGNGNRSEGEQEGRASTTMVSQTNDDNFARTYQGLPQDPGNFNSANTVQVSFGSEVALPGNNGFLNISEIDQVGDLNFADVTQVGDNNESYIDQSTSAPGMAGDPWANEAWVMQGGHLNVSHITQSDGIGIDANNKAVVIQGNVNPNSSGNISTVIQEGVNTVYVFQLDF